MSTLRSDTYADAAYLIAAAEGSIEDTADEMFRLARVYESNEELRTTLSDPHLPTALRQQIVEDLLDGRANPATLAIVSTLVRLDRASDLPKVADALVARAAGERGEAVAEVRTAVALTDDQIARLTEALRARTNSEITIKNIVDPTVMGGVVTQIGDTVLDGTVRNRLNQLREAF